VLEADFFVALRRAIIADPDYGGLESYFVRGMLAHVDPHRPMQLYRADEEHLLAECDCPPGRGRRLSRHGAGRSDLRSMYGDYRFEHGVRPPLRPERGVATSGHHVGGRKVQGPGRGRCMTSDPNTELDGALFSLRAEHPATQ